MSQDEVEFVSTCPWLRTPRKVLTEVAEEFDREGKPRPMIGDGNGNRDLTLEECLRMQGPD